MSFLKLEVVINWGNYSWSKIECEGKSWRYYHFFNYIQSFPGKTVIKQQIHFSRTKRGLSENLKYKNNQTTYFLILPKSMYFNDSIKIWMNSVPRKSYSKDVFEKGEFNVLSPIDAPVSSPVRLEYKSIFE